MFYYFLVPLSDQVPLFNVIRYITFRAGAATMTAMFVCFIFGPAIIRWLKTRQQNGQPIREDGRRYDFVGRFSRHLVVGKPDQ